MKRSMPYQTFFLPSSLRCVCVSKCGSNRRGVDVKRVFTFFYLCVIMRRPPDPHLTIHSATSSQPPFLGEGRELLALLHPLVDFDNIHFQPPPPQQQISYLCFTFFDRRDGYTVCIGESIAPLMCRYHIRK